MNELNSIYENGKHVVFENIDHLNEDGTWGMKSKIVAEFYDLEAHNLFINVSELLEALEECRRAMNHHGIVGDPAQFMADAAIAKARGVE